MKPSSRIHGLDTLRALAIVLVFMNHYMIFVSHKPTFGFFSEIGWAGVDLFFALSGYLIGNQIFGSLRRGGFSLKNFYARRLLRTLPNYYVVLALYAFWPYFAGAAQPAPWWKYFSFTLNFQLIPGTLFSHAWSLCVEEQFYMLLPALALLIAGWRRSLAWAWIAIFASFAAGMLIRGWLWQQVQPPPDGSAAFYTSIYYSTLCRFDELVAGVALALLKNFHRPLWERCTAYGNWTLAAGLLITVLALNEFHDDHYGQAITVAGYPLLGLGFSLLLLSALSPASWLCRLRVPGAAAIAIWSYAIYLTHKQLCILLKPELLKHGMGPESAGAIAIMLLASGLAGWLLYLLVETPFMKLRERYVPSNEAGARAARPAPAAEWQV
ncbi:acyltransferase [Massilia sp. YIM B04103]|uniref:acyltransferase family protein n=1 Tax=Massilia sp. YIM B04103 TaxID=2963106 RepID=UPI00210E5C84|nr:acyltransferase [Massilia sp. YIM B04103]